MIFSHKKITPAFCISIFFLGSVFAESTYSRIKTPLPETVSTLPNTQALKALDLGLHTATASLVWLKINQGVYTWLDKTGKYERFSKEIQTLTDLDPSWGYPYAFGTLLLPGLGKSDLAIQLGEKGIKNAPDDWRIPYYIAIVYHTNLRDRLNAAKYFALAAQTNSAPENIKKMPKVYGSGKNKLEEMEKIWETLYETADNDTLHEQAAKYLLYLKELKKQAR